MAECSLPNLNDYFCHEAIKGGTCPGRNTLDCVNITARERLVLRYEGEARAIWHRDRAARREALSPFGGHFVPQNDQPVARTIEVTLESLRATMRRALKK